MSRRTVSLFRVLWVCVWLVPSSLGAGEDPNTPAPATSTRADDATHLAPNFNLDWYSINSGGAADVASGSLRLGLSVGQSVAGEAEGTLYGLGVGFWYGISSDSASCPIVVAGDVNADGVPNAADVITLVNWIFKSSGQPTPCDAAGDVNCDGLPNAADIVTEVNFVFKSTPLPCHACDSPLAGDC